MEELKDCEGKEIGCIKALLITPASNKPIEKQFSDVEPLLQVGDIMTEKKDDKVIFGSGLEAAIYIKTSDDESI